MMNISGRPDGKKGIVGNDYRMWWIYYRIVNHVKIDYKTQEYKTWDYEKTDYKQGINISAK